MPRKDVVAQIVILPKFSVRSDRLLARVCVWVLGALLDRGEKSTWIVDCGEIRGTGLGVSVSSLL